MATTTNYGWTTPDDTALVKDGAAAIRTLGSSVDTTTKNLNPETTLGDISYRSSTANVNTRLALGTANQQLRVNAGATAPEWFTPAVAAGGMTLISRTSFSSVASQAFDNVFTSTYDTYFVNIDEIYAATVGDDLYCQFRYAGPTTQTADYYASNFGYDSNGTLSQNAVAGGSQFILAAQSGNSTRINSAQLYFNQVGNTSEIPVLNGTIFDNNTLSNRVHGGITLEARTYTGFLLKSSSSNITGTVSIFGVNKS